MEIVSIYEPRRLSERTERFHKIFLPVDWILNGSLDSLYESLGIISKDMIDIRRGHVPHCIVLGTPFESVARDVVIPVQDRIDEGHTNTQCLIRRRRSVQREEDD